jgi:cytochrome c-type biogenesis protein
VVLSPCHLAAIPLIVAFVGDQGLASGRRAFTLSTAFAAGILVSIALVGVITAALGRMLGDVGRLVNYALALIFLVLGLHFLGVFELPGSARGPAATSRRGALGAFLLGLLFGIGVGPCTFAFMAPMLGVALKAAASQWSYAVALLLLFGLGHCAVIVVAGTSAGLVQRALDWHQDSRGARLLRQACGVLIIAGGIYLVYSAP